MKEVAAQPEAVEEVDTTEKWGVQIAEMIFQTRFKAEAG
ncbi:MAG: DUF6783 domain-containing protein [Anaerobutyricum hallii]